jgi:hypothetical protein
MSSCGPPPLWISIMFGFLVGLLFSIIVYLWDKKMGEKEDGKRT